MQTNCDLHITPAANGFIVQTNEDSNGVFSLHDVLVFNTLKQLTEFLESHFSEIVRQENYR